MTDAVTLFPPAISHIRVGGTPEVAIYGPVLGGIVVNPATPSDQGIASVEELFIDITADATTFESATTYALQPGQMFVLPASQTTNVSVNAATAGHKFSAVAIQPPVPYPPTSTAGAFPPAAPPVLDVIPSYLYVEYKDDDDLQAFVSAYNDMAQNYVDWFNDVGLPIYTGLSGSLLDWVAEGLYGITRPSLASGQNKNVGPFNTYVFNEEGVGFNTHKVIGPSNVTVTTDDIFKRIITWAFFKGDGNVFNVRWLKRRIMRFLLGKSGVNFNVDETYPISVTFGVGNQVNITITPGSLTVLGGAQFNAFQLNGIPFNGLLSQGNPTSHLPNEAELKEGIDAGVLELPFQFDWVVTI